MAKPLQDGPKVASMFLRALSKCLLSTDRFGALTMSLGSLSPCLTTLSVKKLFPIFSLNLSWCRFQPFPCILSQEPWNKWSIFSSLLPLFAKLLRATRLFLSFLLSKPDKPKVFSHYTQDIPSRLLNIFAALLWTHLNSFTSFLNCGAQNSAQHTGEAVPALTTVGWSPLLTVYDVPNVPQDGLCPLSNKVTPPVPNQRQRPEQSWGDADCP